MPSQIVLEWEISTANTSFGPAQAVAALGAVVLYADPVTDPVLGQLFGLTVDSDVTAPIAGGAMRTLTLNMDSANAPEAPPPFPCRPITATLPVLPYPLRTTKPLPGSFFVSNGSMVVPTTETQVPSLVIGSVIQFLIQQGVFYEVAAVTPTSITLTAPYTGTTGNTEAFEEIPAPVTFAAIFSTSPLDTNGVATIPAIAPGTGARTVDLTYNDSTGAGPFTVSVQLTGKTPVIVELAPGSIDIAEIVNMVVASTGAFGNSVGQITLVELSDDEPLPNVPINFTLSDLRTLTDQLQMLIERPLAYLPPSYFALSQQGASTPQLEGDFFVTTDVKYVETSVDQTGALNAGDIIQFASQLSRPQALPTPNALNSGKPWVNVDVFYTIEAVGSRNITLTTPYTGLDENFTGSTNPNSNAATKGNLGSKVFKKATGAFKVFPDPGAPPTNEELATLLGQFVSPAVAAPPLPPPLIPATSTPPVTAAPSPAPNFLSDLFTQTLQLALAVPVVPQPITFI